MKQKNYHKQSTTPQHDTYLNTGQAMTTKVNNRSSMNQPLDDWCLTGANADP